jgi:hypothetical protein
MVAIRQYSWTPTEQRETPTKWSGSYREKTSRGEEYSSRRAVESCYYQG